MSNARFQNKSHFIERLATTVTLLVFLGSVLAALANGANAQGGGGITVFGKVSLPDGQPAIRVWVKVEMSTGLKRDMLTDDYGRYELRGLSAGRYHVSATNPDVAEQYSEPATSDSTRSFSNRVQIDVYLRLPLPHAAPPNKPGTISIAEAAQNIPKSARKAFEQGQKLQKENQPDKALTQFEQAIGEYPEYFQALTERGNLRMARNQFAEANADFTAALKANEKHTPALRGLGYCQLQQKQFAAAIANLERAYAAAPEVGLTLMLLGYANLSVERYEPARQCLQEALRLDAKGAARAHVYLAEIFAHEQKFKEAAEGIQTYLKLNPQAADAAQLKALEAQWRARSK